MRVCMTYGSPSDYNGEEGCREYRLDVFDTIPDTDEETVLTLCGKDISLIPNGFAGLVDVGEKDVPSTFRKIVSYHDFRRTPSAEEIVSILESNTAEITKGAFSVNSFKDLISILDASKSLNRRHVLLGMGETGTVTRLRQNLLRNEFTFGYIGCPTAPGQLSADDMEALGDNCSIVGVTGHPLAHSLSPIMQNAALMTAGINGVYLKFPSETVDDLGDAMRGYDILGMNVTIPHKSSVMDEVDTISDTADAIGAVNTVINRNGTLIGDNTDSKGIEFAFRNMEIDAGTKVLVMGSGGAARAAVHAMTQMGCEITVTGRNTSTVRSIAEDFSVTGTNVADTSDFEVIMNCTPIGMEGEGEYPAKLSLKEGHIVFDAVYNRITPLMDLAQRSGCKIADGKDMLIGQGAESFRLWFGKDADTDAMRRALI